MATLLGFTRPADPVETEKLSAHVSIDVAKPVWVEVDANQAIAKGPSITEADRVAIQASINTYNYVPPEGQGMTDAQGMIETERLGKGTADATTFLRGDRMFAPLPAGGAVSSVNARAGDVVLTPDDLDDTGAAHKFTTTIERAKLASIAPGATVNSPDATLVARANHTGTQSADTITDGAANKVLTAAERTKLAAFSGTNTGDQDLSGLVPKTTTVAGKPLGGNVSLVKGDVGLGAVDNVADSGKPISAAQQAALDLKAPLASPAFTGTPTGITKAHVGLGAVDNTSDVNKPVSSATQTALNAKEPAIAAGTPAQYLRGDKTLATLDKVAVGLAAVDNTSDASKPLSTADVAALAGKSDSAHTHAVYAPAPVYALLANGAVAMAFGTNSAVKVTPTATATFTTTVPPAGAVRHLIVLTSGVTSFTITFGAGFKPTATLATGTTAARVFVLAFVSDGANLYEVSRTVAMVA